MTYRIESITVKFDRSDIMNGLMNNGMSRADAQKTANRAVQLYQTAETKTEDALKALEAQAETLSDNLEDAIKGAKNTATKVTKTASHMGWWGFLGGLIGAIISSICGYYGYRSRKETFKF